MLGHTRSQERSEGVFYQARGTALREMSSMRTCKSSENGDVVGCVSVQGHLSFMSGGSPETKTKNKLCTTVVRINDMEPH